VEHTLVALTCGAGLIGIDAGDDDDLIGYLLLDSAETGNICKDGLAVVGRARADDQDELVRATVEHGTDAFIQGGLDLYHMGGERILLFDILGDGELSVEIHLHCFVPRFFGMD
jgi:hypothetical protein